MFPTDRIKVAATGLNKVKLSDVQNNSIDAIITSCDKHGVTNPKQIAYILATAYHEARLKPIEEIGKGAGHAYGKPDSITGQVYYGRGFVQLTWKANYKTFSDLLKVNMIDKPEYALEVPITSEIIVVGMLKGMFTGATLNRFFNDKVNYPINARKIINGLDKAELISTYYNEFLKFLK